MNKVKLKILSQKIADAEMIIQNSKDKKMIKEAKQQILELTESITNLEDLFALDEEIQKIFGLNKNK